MYYGTEKQEWINDVVNDFNKRKMTACDGLLGPITITPIPMGSGESMRRILLNRPPGEQALPGYIQPDIWCPAGSTWLALHND